MVTKLTKKDRFATLIDILNGEIAIADIDVADLSDFCQKEIDALDAKAAKAKAKAAEKKAAPDALTDAIKAVLNDELMTVPQIIDALGDSIDEDVTPQKVSYRCSSVLVKEGFAEKGDVKVPATDGTKARTLVGYKLA